MDDITTKDLKNYLLAEAVREIPLPAGFRVPVGMPVPLKDFIFALQITGDQGQDMLTTEGGIILPSATNSDPTRSNSIVPFTALVYAVGPEVEDYIRPGMRVMFNPFADVEIMIKGVFYRRLRQSSDIYAILPPDTFVYEGVHTETYRRRAKRIGEWEMYYQRKMKHDENVLDKKTEMEKKKP